MSSCPQCQVSVPDEAQFCPSCGASLQPTEDDVPNSFVGRILNQKYRLNEQLAEGGMAVVYKAQHIMLEDICAVKIIKRSLANKEEMLKRFQREAKLTRQVARRSKYVISIYDFGIEDQIGFFYVMELLNGHPFTDLIQDPRNPPTPERGAILVCQICEALQVVHEEGLVHRDIKPDNIFLHYDTATNEEMVKLLDFGIARSTTPKSTMLTSYGRVMGTPEYMSPEQCKGPTPQQYERGESHLDGRSDIYSLGVLFYQCLSGDVPFPMPSDGGPMAIHKVMAGHVMEQPVAPHLRRPDLPIPRALSDVVLKALAKDPKDRFQTMLEFRDAIQAALAAPLAKSSPSNPSPERFDTLPLSSSSGSLPSPRVRPPPSQESVVKVAAPAAIGAAAPSDAIQTIDRTAMDVQLPPGAIEDALAKWQQQQAETATPLFAPSSHDDLSQTPSEGSVSWKNAISRPASSSTSDLTPDEGSINWMGEASSSTSESPDLGKTVTSPLDPKIMDEIRRKAKESGLLKTNDPATPDWYRTSKDPKGSPPLTENRSASNSSSSKGLIITIVALSVLLVTLIVVYFVFLQNP